MNLIQQLQKKKNNYDCGGLPLVKILTTPLNIGMPKKLLSQDGPFETSNIQDLFDMKINTG
jgi:hypothetical protein